MKKLHELHIGKIYLTLAPDEPLFELGQAETPIPEGVDLDALEEERLRVLAGLQKTIAERRAQ